MAEYIKREALFEKALEEKRFVFRMEDLLRHEVVFQTVYGDFAEFVNSIPAEDVVKVVHCRDCKKLGKPNCPMEDSLVKNPWKPPKSGDFCSYGERRG